MKRINHILIASVLLPSLFTSMTAAETLSAPVDAALPAQIIAAAGSAEASGNYAVALRERKRLLELYPNEPGLQAPIYLAMSVDAGKAGDAEQSSLFASVSSALDPTLADRAAHAGGGSALTRGGNSKADTILAFASAALAGYIAVRAARPQQPDPSTQQQGNYPPAPYGQQGYVPPQGNQYAPAPGYSDPNASQGTYQQQPQQQSYPTQQNQYPQQQSQYPQQQQMQYPQQQTQYPQQQPQQQSQYPQQQPPYQQPQQQAQYPQQQGQYQQPSQQSQYQQPIQPGQYQQPPQGTAQQNANYYPPPPPAPYGPPQNYSPAPLTRGEKAPVLKVVYDRSRLGDTTYFANGCGALLTTSGGNLIFTPACREAPRVIPTSDVWEVRLNSTVGRDVGGFHIVTKKGLYLNLAPANGSRDEARSDVDSLRKALGLDH